MRKKRREDRPGCMIGELGALSIPLYEGDVRAMLALMRFVYIRLLAHPSLSIAGFRTTLVSYSVRARCTVSRTCFAWSWP